jgi:hypothetical protein
MARRGRASPQADRIGRVIEAIDVEIEWPRAQRF